MKVRHAAIPWQQIAGAGNIYRHNYDNILESFVWTTVKHSLPALLTAIDAEFD